MIPLLYMFCFARPTAKPNASHVVQGRTMPTTSGLQHPGEDVPGSIDQAHRAGRISDALATTSGKIVKLCAISHLPSSEMLFLGRRTAVSQGLIQMLWCLFLLSLWCIFSSFLFLAPNAIQWMTEYQMPNYAKIGTEGNSDFRQLFGHFN